LARDTGRACAWLTHCHRRCQEPRLRNLARFVTFAICPNREYQTMAKRREFIGISAALMASSVLPLPAAAQAYPARPIKYICPWPAGGSTDVVMRSLAEAAGRHLGRPSLLKTGPAPAAPWGRSIWSTPSPTATPWPSYRTGFFGCPTCKKWPLTRSKTSPGSPA